jgi:transcriptional regulator with XRE-family HTH domain
MLRIEEIMKLKGVGVTELANILRVNRQTVYYYIKQDDKNPVSQLEKIADALNVPITELFERPAIDIINCPHCGGVIKVGKG